MHVRQSTVRFHVPERHHFPKPTPVKGPAPFGFLSKQQGGAK